MDKLDEISERIINWLDDMFENAGVGKILDLVLKWCGKPGRRGSWHGTRTHS